MRPRPNRVLLAGLAVVALTKAADLSDRGPALPVLELDPLGWSAIAATSAEDAEADETPEAEAANSTACMAPDEAFEAVLGERALLADQRDDIAVRRTDLELGREKLRIETERLSQLRDELAGFMARVEAAQSADVERLIELYRAMKPKEAAAIMDDVDMEVVIAVMGGMAARDAAPIMAQLDPTRARAISRLLLERAKLPGDRDLGGIRLR